MKINVKLLGETSNFHYQGKTYKPGDVFSIDEKDFVPYLMRKMDVPKKGISIVPNEQVTSVKFESQKAGTQEDTKNQEEHPVEAEEKTKKVTIKRVNK